MANRYWVGGTASWDGTAGTKWALTSGGAGGQSVPTSADDVFFDGASGAVTCTIASGNTGAKSITCTGFTGTLAGSAAITVAGSVTLVAGMTVTYSGTLTLSATGTLTTAGKTIGPLTINGSGIVVTLGDALTSSGAITLTLGELTTANYNITATSFSSTVAGTRALTLGSSTFTLTTGSFSVLSSSSFTLSAGTSTLTLNGTSSSIAVDGSFAVTGLTFYNVTYANTTANASAVVITGRNTFNNVTIVGPSTVGTRRFDFQGVQTINGTLSTSGTASNRRIFLRNSTLGSNTNLIINSPPSISDVDFRDVYVTGTAAPISGTRLGNLWGNTNITFPAPKTVYWVTSAGGNFSDNNWSNTSGGAPSLDYYPLMQDIAVIENTGLNTSATVAGDSLSLIIGFPNLNMSTRTNAMTFTYGTQNPFLGDLALGTGVTTFGGSLIFGGRGTHTITSNGVTISTTSSVIFNNFSGQYSLGDAFTIDSTRTIQLLTGTFNSNNYAITGGVLSVSSGATPVTASFGSSTITLNASFTTQLTVGSSDINTITGTYTINITDSAVVIDSSSSSSTPIYNLVLTSTAVASNHNVLSGVYRNITVSPPATDGIITANFASLTITGTATFAGASPARRVRITSYTSAPYTLTVGTLSATDCDFFLTTIAGTAAGSSPTRAGDLGGNSGITFPAPKTVYWNLGGSVNWSDNGWATSSGGAPAVNNFPLAQDTVIFDNTGAAGTVTFNQAYAVGTFNASARTSAMTLAVNSTMYIYGNWSFGTGVTATGASTFRFSKTFGGTQTITSNGVAFPYSVNIDTFRGTSGVSTPTTVQLADALTISAGTLSMGFGSVGGGIFDAVSYNVTAPAFTSTSSPGTEIIKMGSGLWTLTGTANVFYIPAGSNRILYKDTANILLSNNSTTDRVFSSVYSVNKVTIGGTSSTSTTTFSSLYASELASTKTVAHTIALSTSGDLYIGKWSVTGTLGNVVTLTNTGGGKWVLVGAASSGIDYLAMGTTGFSTASPGEFYAGANSTGSAAAPVYRTAPPAATTRYWVGGSGTWDNTTTTNWSTSSGGAGGASVPTSLDNVVFDTSSSTANAAYTVTIGAGTSTAVRAKNITMGGPGAGNDITWAGSGSMILHGDFSLTAGTADCVRTFTGDIVLSGSTTGKTFNTNGVTLNSNIVVLGDGCGWSLTSALSTDSTKYIRIGTGSLNFAGYAATAGGISNYANFIGSYNISSSYGATKTLSFGSGTTTVSNSSSPIDFNSYQNWVSSTTINANTSQINVTATGSVFCYFNNFTLYNVEFTAGVTSSTLSLLDPNTFNNLTFAGVTSSGIKTISFSRASGGALTSAVYINGTLTFSAGTDATCRNVLAGSGTVLLTNDPTPLTLSVAAFSGTDVDFMDTIVTGGAAPISGTRLGDRKGNTGITFPSPKTVYVRSTGSDNWSSPTGWSATSGGAADATQFPLPQDNVVFPATTYPASGSTITLDSSYAVGNVDMSLRTTDTVTLSFAAAFYVNGNWINGTGTTISNTNPIVFSGRGAQTITSAGVTFTNALRISSPGGTVTLQDSFVSNRSATFAVNTYAGTLNLNGYNLTLTGALATFNSSGFGTRGLSLGTGGTLSISGSGTSAFSLGSLTNLYTVSGSGTIRLTSASSKSFIGASKSYTDITLDQGGAGTLTIGGYNTFKNITNSYKSTGATQITLSSLLTRVYQFTAAGESGRLLTINASPPGAIVYLGAGTVSTEYVNLTGPRVYPLTNTWYATNAVAAVFLGFTLDAAPPASTGNFFLVF